MTAEKIKEIADMDIGAMTLDEFQAVREAAGMSPFLMICYAYCYGFLHGRKAERAGRKKVITE